VKQVVVVAAGTDETAVGVQQALTRLGARVHFLDTSRIPEDGTLSLQDGVVRAGEVTLSEAGSVYVKSVHLAVPLFDVETLAQRKPKSWPQRWIAERERHALITSALRAMEAGGAHFVNSLARFEVHLLKPLQSELLARAGVAVPSTLTTNDPEAVRAFAALHGDVIYKPLAGGALVRRLTAADLTTRRLVSLSTAPVLFQQRIEGLEYRVTVLAGEAIAAYRLPAHGVVDAREVLEQAKKVKVPREVGALCVRAAKALGLVFTSVDVRVNEAGAPFVLECNPTPSIAFYESPSRSPILRALAAHLISHA
jgi:glutathione synthase/RimK-type ligase-like ATP-grasp enzyme